MMGVAKAEESLIAAPDPSDPKKIAGNLDKAIGFYSCTQLVGFGRLGDIGDMAVIVAPGISRSGCVLSSVHLLSLVDAPSVYAARFALLASIPSAWPRR